MALTLILSSGAHVLASDDEFFPTQYLKKYQVQTELPTSTFLSLIYKKKKIAQKAFLAALICSLGIDLEVTVHRMGSKVPLNFTIKKIGNSNIYSSSPIDHDPQIIAMLDVLKTYNYKFEIKNTKMLTVTSAKINDYFLNQTTILKIGEKILKLIYEKKQIAIKNHTSSKSLNLTNDVMFRNETFNILGDMLKNNPAKDEDKFKFFELPSDLKKLEPITNPDHLNYLKEYPDTLSEIMTCYQKTFFVGLLSTSKIRTLTKEPAKKEKDNFPDCISLCQINNFSVRTKVITNTSLTYLIKVINYVFDSEKLKIESLQISSLMPTKVTINNQISLNENDIFNLGQRFYNLFYSLSHEGIIKNVTNNRLCLNEVPKFTQGVKEIFKEYTGTDLPDLK